MQFDKLLRKELILVDVAGDSKEEILKLSHSNQIVEEITNFNRRVRKFKRTD